MPWGFDSLILRRPRSFAVPFASLPLPRRGREAKGTANDLGRLRIRLGFRGVAQGMFKYRDPQSSSLRASSPIFAKPVSLARGRRACSQAINRVDRHITLTLEIGRVYLMLLSNCHQFLSLCTERKGFYMAILPYY